MHRWLGSDEWVTAAGRIRDALTTGPSTVIRCTEPYVHSSDESETIFGRAPLKR
jgi:hypothetical protein